MFSRNPSLMEILFSVALKFQIAKCGPHQQVAFYLLPIQCRLPGSSVKSEPSSTTQKTFL